MVDILAPSSQTVVTMLCEKLALKGASVAGKVYTASVAA